MLIAVLEEGTKSPFLFSERQLEIFVQRHQAFIVPAGKCLDLLSVQVVDAIKYRVHFAAQFFLPLAVFGHTAVRLSRRAQVSPLVTKNSFERQASPSVEGATTISVRRACSSLFV